VYVSPPEFFHRGRQESPNLNAVSQYSPSCFPEVLGLTWWIEKASFDEEQTPSPQVAWLCCEARESPVSRSGVAGVPRHCVITNVASNRPVSHFDIVCTLSCLGWWDGSGAMYHLSGVGVMVVVVGSDGKGVTTFKG
jgi:hypothetical protein